MVQDFKFYRQSVCVNIGQVAAATQYLRNGFEENDSHFNKLKTKCVHKGRFTYQNIFFIIFSLLQACDSILLGKYPAPDTTLYLLAALRLQFNEGDYKPGAWV